MKKNIILIAAIIAFSFSIKAQTTEQIVANFKTLVEEATSDFKNVKGELIVNDSTTSTTFYNCTKTLGSAFEAVCINTSDNSTYFSSKFEFSETKELLKANEILPEIVNEVNAMVKSGKYSGRDYKKTETIDITEVKDLDGNYIIEIESKYDPAGTNNYLMFVIYGKSWGKK